MKYWYLYLPAVIFFALPFLYAIFKQQKAQMPADREDDNNGEEDEDNNDDGSGNVRVIIRNRM